MATKTYITTENLGRFKTKLNQEVATEIDSKIAAIPEYELPTASETELGGVKVGAGLAINENGVLSATGGGTADSVDWANVQDKPTTLKGYGLTAEVDEVVATATTGLASSEAVTQEIIQRTKDLASNTDVEAHIFQVGNQIVAAENRAKAYTDIAVTGLAATTYVDSAVAGLASTAYVDGKVSGIYHFKGSVADLAALQAITDAEAGDVYNIADTGMNAAWVAPVGDIPGFWDDFGTIVDLSGYVLSSELVAATEADIDALFTPTV